MKNILLMEDDACLRSIIREFLLRENYEVIIAKNALIGLQFAAQLEPDLIISDLNIPYLNGYTVLKQVRSNLKTAKIPFILIASDHTGEKRSYALELGANDYLIKPFKCNELLQAITRQFSQKQLSSINHEK